ncbi:DUF559 domain-containing protein [Leifsonia sp. ZF2019]|uniref:DUF559 domain-containing protein n=1 Tax=Leifsonia sp. ZF2019 TaxID=2781978 RepID=UPI001CBCE029|nr:DUF559 domain-containing protein [Leifsonia sp. ZF2019]UAJ77746.1 DUF559 domain-containing protein [Leifsonia sp. ZF2019]
MRRPEPLPPILRSPAFSTATARSAGVNDGRLRRGDLARPHHGVRVPHADRDGSLEGACRAYRAAMPATQCFSHSTAAALHGLSLPGRLRAGGPLHVATLRGGRAPRGVGIVGHKLRITADEVTLVHGLRVPSVEETWVELAAELSVTELVLAGDACLRRRSPLSSVDALRGAVEDARTRPGVRRLRQAVELLRPGTDSPMESLLRLMLVDAGLPEPAVNLPVFTAGGLVLHGDLVYPVERVVVEYDGDHHRTDPVQYERDVDRLWALEQAGWRVVRINRSHVARGSRPAVDRVRRVLAQQRGRVLP